MGFIAQAGISSSLAFLDFLGVNGQNQSLSIITFNLTTDVNETGSLQGSAYGCDYDVNSHNNTLEGYTGVINSTCSYCADVCVAPNVDTKIAFFDGFNFVLWSVSWSCFLFLSGCLVLFNFC